MNHMTCVDNLYSLFGSCYICCEDNSFSHAIVPVIAKKVIKTD